MLLVRVLYSLGRRDTLLVRVLDTKDTLLVQVVYSLGREGHNIGLGLLLLGIEISWVLGREEATEHRQTSTYQLLYHILAGTLDVPQQLCDLIIVTALV